ncbi:Fur family transcriptional regulator [Blastococcus atacamensis]|uniref:Fur family transcriptional regulator n=1 Tax=Blastococcus atacamensis TaxID=2070508 RepID=UPI000CEC61DC|nr:Fur family transcriptional regulator [Blastococcus atacamensis]
METTWAHQLREAGLRVTRPRLSVLGVLAQHPHADADTIVTGAREQHPSLSPQAVYGVLKAFVAAGIARRIEPAGAPALFELRVGDNHHHLVCRSCGAVADVDCTVGAAPCLTPSDTAGFVIDEAEVVFWGLCRQCHDRDRQVAVGAEAVQFEQHEIRGGARA